MANKLTRYLDKLPTLEFPQEGLSAGRIAVRAEVLVIALLDDVTTPTVEQFDSSNVVVASEPDVESATPDERLGDTANYLEFQGQTDANEYMKVTLAAEINLDKYNFIGYWAQFDTTIGATDYDIELRNNGSIVNGGTLSLPAITITGEWQWIEHDITAVDRSAVDEVRLLNTTADNDVIDLQYMIAYDYSNGHGPVDGFCSVEENIGSTTLDRGDWANQPVGRQTGVAQAVDNDANVIGVTVLGGAVGVNCLIQRTGDIIAEVGTGGTTAGLQAVPTAAQVADDDATQAAGFGLWRETGNAGAHLRLTLGSQISTASGATVNADGVTYDDDNAHTSETDVNGALDELYQALDGTGRVSVNFATVFESDGTNLVALLGIGTTPVLDMANGDTDSNLDILWVSSNQDAIIMTLDLPTDLDDAKDITVNVSGLMDGVADTPVIDIDSYFDNGDTKVTDATTAFGNSQATETATIGNADIPSGARKLTMELTPGAHGTDVLTVNGIWITFTKKLITS